MPREGRQAAGLHGASASGASRCRRSPDVRGPRPRSLAEATEHRKGACARSRDVFVSLLRELALS